MNSACLDLRTVVSASAALLFMASPYVAAQTFEEEFATASKAPATQSEAAIISLLKSGIESAKPTQASDVAEGWLRQNLPENAELLYLAGRAAELSGEASNAGALYQQYLKKADPKSENAGLAFIAVHALLREQLNDLTAAYSFNRSTGDSLSVNPMGRQFDQWFLSEAKKRNDAVTVANRLRAVVEAKIPEADLINFYEEDFRWLLEHVDGYIERGNIRVSKELAAACKELAKTMSFNGELALKLDWAASVAAYNLAKLADEDVAPPVAEAEALLAKYPHYALWVQNGWAGGGNGPHYRGDTAKYWPHETDAKMAPVAAAAPKLSPLQLARLMRSWREGFYADKVSRPLNTAAVREFVTSNSELVNSRNGLVVLEKAWNQYTPEEAKALASGISAIDQEEVSLIRAVAAGGEGKDIDKMASALLGPEAWRLDPNRMAAWVDQLWHYAGRPGGNEKRDQWIRQAQAAAENAKKAVGDKNAAPQQRLAAFKTLWADYRSGQPKIPGGANQLSAILKTSPEAVAELMRDRSVEAQLLLRETISGGITSSDPVWQDVEANTGIMVTKYEPMALFLAQRHAGGTIAELKKRRPEKARAHPLEPNFRKLVQDGLKQNQLEPWEVLAWINMQFPEDNAEQVKLVQELIKSPLWKDMPTEVRFAANRWFGKDVLSAERIASLESADPNLISKDLLALVEEVPEGEEAGKKKKKPKAPKEDVELDDAAKAAKAAEDVRMAVAALTSTIEGIRKSPVRTVIPGKAMENLATLDPAIFSDPESLELILVLTDKLKVVEPTTNFGTRLFEAVSKQPDPMVVHRLAPYIWAHVNFNLRTFDQVKGLTGSLVEESPSSASAMANTGLDAIARHRGHTYYKTETDIPLLKSIRGKAAMKMGLIVIPVPPNHPAYPVYQSQADWMTGNEDSAGELLDQNWEPFLEVHRELSVPYLLWSLQRTIYGRDEERQQTLIKALLGWAEETGSPLNPTEKAQIEIAYGDIAMQRGQLGQAHEIYSRTQQKEAYQELSIRYEAALRRVATERVARNFDGALKTIGELELERVPEIWEDVRYERALVFYDMEEFEDAKDDIDSILDRNPNQADAKILLGKVQLKRQKLMEATEVELGTAESQNSLVPGERLKVTLVDPTLAVSGAGTEIEVVVWSTSGDKETFFLRQFGDSKTKFRGEVDTALGEPKPGDDLLQVIGDDEIFYAYSERFREKMNGLEEKRGGPIRVASDAILMASARKLLSEAEQRTADMESVMESIKVKGDANAEGAAKAAMAARAMSAEARAEDDGFKQAEFERFMTNVAKPGNPVHVRVVDPDRSRTAGIDELDVSVSTSSGDSIARITLKETGTHTGWFEGSIPTTGAQALAFARESEPGRNPNMVISPKAGTYPAWRALPVEGKSPEFTVDLNDNAAIDELTIVAKEEDAVLKKFYLQTGMNEDDLRTVAAYPVAAKAPKNPWAPSVVVINDTDAMHTNATKRSVYDFGELAEQMERGWISQQYHQGYATNVAGVSDALPGEVMEEVDWKRQARHDVSSVIYRFRGHFYEPSEVTRRFKLNLGRFDIPKDTHPSINHAPNFMLVVDGRPITSAESGLDGKINLKAGLHTFEIWGTGWVANMGFGKREPSLQANLETEDGLTDVPDNFFNPDFFPENILQHRNSPTEIVASEGGSSFKVKFAPGSRTRMLKLVFVDQEGPVPALNELVLTGPEDEKILPVAEDFASLNKNQTLEILTGDKIAVRYVDDRFVTKTKERHERSLEVSFTDARAEFADMEPRYSQGHGKDMPYYEKLLRFPYGEPLDLAIHDADMDVSVEPDTVKVRLQAVGGEGREFEATETGDSTGIFRVTVVPVEGAAKKESELQVSNGGKITATYLDTENNRPGVPTERVATISHAAFVVPELRLSHATVTPFETETTRSLIHGFENRDYNDPTRERISSERVSPTWLVDNKMVPSTQPPEGGIQAVHGRTMYLELIAPQLALGTSSEVTVYAQTDAGRKRANFNGEGFDITVPGTIALTSVTGRPYVAPGDWRMVPQLEIYQGGEIPSSATPQYDRFKMSVPLIAGMLPLGGALTYEERKQLQKDAENSRSAATFLEQLRSLSGLVAQAGEKIHFGFQYTDDQGNEKWLTASAKVTTHPAFDIMTEDYREPMTAAYVGETLNLRVVDLGADLTDGSDKVSVLVQGKESGEKHLVELLESGPHTGIFRADPVLAYAKINKKPPEGDGEIEAAYDVNRDGFPVVYGDTVAARYTDANGEKTGISMVSISKGADGTIQPFSKVYEDEEIATRTQFSLAEAYLEMAKRHRKLDEPEAAAIEYASAKQLLSKAMDEFTDPETRAHAEYLLGTLTMEEADATEDAETQEIRYRAALSRFQSVTGSYPQTLPASKAQYQIATLYERLKEPEIAAQEYVKLAYKHPDSEYLATSMARLGSHFLKKAAEYEAKAKPLLENLEDKDAQYEGTAMKKMADREYIKTAQIFGRLQERFPSDSLAGQAGLRAGQSYMRADKKREAIDAFEKVMAEQSYDGPQIRAQAMYWTGMCFQDLRQQMAAYSTFKRLTYDFPESKWASYARAQLSQESLLKLETDLELQRLEGEQ